MMVQKLIKKSLQLGRLGLLSNCHNQPKITTKLTVNAQQAPKELPLKKRATHMQSLREFFMHPLTWDRNSGFLNVILCMAVMGICFISSCPGDNADKKLPHKK